MIQKHIGSKYIEDGVDHINAYSKSKCELGRMLSNFYPIDVVIDGINFKSLEAYWYFLLTNDMSITQLSGNEAKQHGKQLVEKLGREVIDDEFKSKFTQALRLKITSDLRLLEALKSTTVPITHYYVTESGKRLETGHTWLTDAIMLIRSENVDIRFSNYFKKRLER